MYEQRKRHLTIEQACDYTGFGQRIIREAFKRGDLDAYRPGNFEKARLYFDPDELDRWIESIKASKAKR